MPTPPKALDNMNKNLTDEERQLREQAEQGVIPDRGRESRMEKPAIMTKNAAASRYWQKVLERMEGLVILDDLDSEMLAIYCSALSRREALNALCRELMSAMEKTSDAGNRLAMIEKLDGLMAKLQSHEKTLLSYADKLGMTPEARARLARKRAAQEAEKDPDADLFGD